MRINYKLTKTTKTEKKQSFRTNNIANFTSIHYTLSALAKSFIESSIRSLCDQSAFYDYMKNF